MRLGATANPTGTYPMTTRFSIIIPAFNSAATLARAIESVLIQSWPAYEIIVVDDGSTDATAEVARQFGDMIYLIQQTNSGVSAARNAGAAVATGDWLAFLDADDLWEKNKLLAQLAAAVATSSGFVCGAINGNPVMPSGQISAFNLWKGNFVATSTVLVKREILLQLLPVFNTTMAFAEDYLAWIKCLMLTKGYYVAENLATYILSTTPRYNWRGDGYPGRSCRRGFDRC